MIVEQLTAAAEDFAVQVMTSATVAETIQTILAPGLMVSACALLANGMFTRHVVVNDRLRGMAHERLELLEQYETITDTYYLDERLQEIDAQFPDLIRRHRLTHRALLVLYVAVCIFIVDMFTIGFNVITNGQRSSEVALGVFLLGVCTMLVGLLLTLFEVNASRRSVLFEVRRIQALKPRNKMSANL